MDRDRRDARVGPVDRLDAVAVMDVEVDVHHPQTVASGPRDRERRIVVHAETRGRAGMAWCSPPPGWKACCTSPRRIASIARSEPPATDADASCIPANAGVSPGPIPARLGAQRLLREGFDGLEVARLVDPRDLSSVAGWERTRHGPQRLQQRDARARNGAGSAGARARSRTWWSAGQRRAAEGPWAPGAIARQRPRGPDADAPAGTRLPGNGCARRQAGGRA